MGVIVTSMVMESPIVHYPDLVLTPSYTEERVTMKMESILKNLKCITH